MASKEKHLDYIQDIISRMAANSFQLKGWAVAIVTGILALSVAIEQRAVLVSISFFPVFTFWILDGYFLWQERLFRGEYDRVRKLEGDESDFMINPTTHIRKWKHWWIGAMFSKTLNIFYLSLLIVLAITEVWLWNYSGPDCG